MLADTIVTRKNAYIFQTSFGLSFPNNTPPEFFMDQTDKQLGEWQSC